MLALTRCAVALNRFLATAPDWQVVLALAAFIATLGFLLPVAIAATGLL
jgi:hypothetical protein